MCLCKYVCACVCVREDVFANVSTRWGAALVAMKCVCLCVEVSSARGDCRRLSAMASQPRVEMCVCVCAGRRWWWAGKYGARARVLPMHYVTHSLSRSEAVVAMRERARWLGERRERARATTVSHAAARRTDGWRLANIRAQPPSLPEPSRSCECQIEQALARAARSLHVAHLLPPPQRVSCAPAS